MRTITSQLTDVQTGGIIGSDFDYFFERSQVNFYLAKIYEQSGNTTQAIEYYSKVLEQWNDADEDLPDLIDAKALYAKLKEADVK